MADLRQSVVLGHEGHDECSRSHAGVEGGGQVADTASDREPRRLEDFLGGSSRCHLLESELGEAVDGLREGDELGAGRLDRSRGCGEGGVHVATRRRRRRRRP